MLQRCDMLLALRSGAVDPPRPSPKSLQPKESGQGLVRARTPCATRWRVRSDPEPGTLGFVGNGPKRPPIRLQSSNSKRTLLRKPSSATPRNTLPKQVIPLRRCWGGISWNHSQQVVSPVGAPSNCCSRFGRSRAPRPLRPLRALRALRASVCGPFTLTHRQVSDQWVAVESASRCGGPVGAVGRRRRDPGP